MTESKQKPDENQQDAQFLPPSGSAKAATPGRRYLMPLLALVILLALALAWWALDWPLAIGSAGEQGAGTEDRMALIESAQQKQNQNLAELQSQQTAWQSEKDREIDQRLAELSQQFSGQQARIQGSMDALNSSQAGLAQRLSRVEQRLLNLAAQTTGGREVIQFTEMEFLLRHAARRLQLAADPEGALVVLQQAQDILASLSEPALTGISQELAATLAALESAPKADLSRISGQLLALERSVPDWPLAETTQGSSDSTAADQDATWWQRLKGGLGELVVVRKRADSNPVLLQVNEARALRANVQIELTAARLAALRRDKAAYQSALAQAEQWRKQYFSTNDESVRKAGRTLTELAGITLNPDYPDLAPLLEQLQRQRQLMALPTTSRAPAPQTSGPVLIDPATPEEQSAQQSADAAETAEEQAEERAEEPRQP